MAEPTVAVREQNILYDWMHKYFQLEIFLEISSCIWNLPFVLQMGPRASSDVFKAEHL